MNIFAVDQSTRSSGWCHTIDGEVVGYGVVKTPNELTGIRAALWQADAIEEGAVACGAEALAVEHLFIPNKNGKNGEKKQNPEVIFLLGELKGMLIHVAHQRGMELVVVTSAELCGHIGVPPFTPRKQKKLASRHVAAMELFGDRMRYIEIPEDAADAIAIAGVAGTKLRYQELGG